MSAPSQPRTRYHVPNSRRRDTRFLPPSQIPISPPISTFTMRLAAHIKLRFIPGPNYSPTPPPPRPKPNCSATPFAPPGRVLRIIASRSQSPPRRDNPPPRKRERCISIITSTELPTHPTPPRHPLEKKHYAPVRITPPASENEYGVVKRVRGDWAVRSDMRLGEERDAGGNGSRR
jgi:hypothetical protein